MFKLESYITPILLNHVTKYVKNIRPQDAQVSLWEGEVAFQNLDLRLDVLEEELNLPFEFLSGHIHELTIHVPWTKISSEPINVTINTIEFVLKLKDHNNETHNTSAPTTLSELTSTEKNDMKKKKNNKVDEVQQSGGYMPGLVNKIINNIAINCHNIILKYVEEDIVVSMNVQLLSVHSANKDWLPAFTEISPTKFLVRKLIQISDLTICLDKRNSMGQIDVCQEPILYRCSLELRLMRKYYGNYPQTSITRFGLSTPSMELNVSSLQFPMVMRLLALLWALKSGELKAKYETDSTTNDNNTDDEDNIAGANGESYMSWMWNMLPSFLFEETESVEKIDQSQGHFLDIGIYVGNLKLTLKSSELIYDSIVGATKKIRYNPILRVSLGGIFSETLIANKKNWFNTKAGVAKIFVEPLGSFSEDDTSYLITTNTEVLQSYLDDSLFDKNSINRGGGNKFITSVECYLEKNTEDYMIYRGPCFAADLVQYKEYVELVNIDLPLETPTESEQDKSITRIFSASINIKYNLTFAKILDTLEYLMATYDYPPYTETTNKLPSTSVQQQSPALLKNDNKPFTSVIAVKTLEFSMYKMTIELHAKNEEFHKLNKSNTKSKCSSIKLHNQLPYFVIAAEVLHGKWSTPLEQQNLIHSFEQNPKKPKDLLNELYDNYKILVTNFTVKLSDNGQKYPLILTPKCSLTVRKILQNNLAMDDNVKIEANIAFETLILKFSRPQISISLKLLDIIKEYNYDNSCKLLKSKGLSDIHDHDFNFLENTFNNVSIDLNFFPHIIGCVGHVHSAQSLIRSHIKNSVPNLIFYSPENKTSNVQLKNDWLKWIVQFPNKFTSTTNSLYLAVQLRSYVMILTPLLNDFLKYEDAENKNDIIDIVTTLDNDLGLKLTEKIFKRSLKSERNFRKFSLPEETIHLSSEKDDLLEAVEFPMTLNDNKITSSEIIRFFGFMRINIDIKSGILNLVNERTPIESIHSIKSNSLEYTKIMLPTIHCRSANVDDLVQNTVVFPISKPARGSFPWTCAISDFNISSEMKLGNKVFLHPMETNISLVLTNKREYNASDKTMNFTRKNDHLKLNRNTRDLANERMRLRTQPTESINTKHKESLSSISLDSFSADAGSKDKRNMTFTKISPNKSNNPHLENAYFNKLGYPKPVPDLNTVNNIKKEDDKIKFQKIEYDNCSINLHIDTTPIDIDISIEQANNIQKGLNILFNAIRNLRNTKNNAAIVTAQDNYRILEQTEDDDPSIKEFLEYDTNSDQSIEQCDSKLMLCVWLQWTITKVTITLEGAAQDQKTKATIEMEDIITSLDKHIDYIKIKNKIGTFTVRYFQLNKRNEWIRNDTFNVKMQLEQSQAPFFNLIVTFAETESYFKKLFARKKNGALNCTLSEILITIQPLEILADLDRLDEFSAVIEFLQDHNSESESNISSLPYIVSDLPLIYIDCYGFTIYMPVMNVPRHCDVCILKIEDIKLTPNVKNPLSRLPVRPDVYNKAAQMGILYTPGSIIEDRQYELCFSNISAATANWSDILSHMNNKTNNFHNTNPAFEWNRHSRTKPSIKTQQIISRFVVAVTYAPCIAYNKILICGQSIELNCVTDLVVSLTTDQLTMFNCMIARILDIDVFSKSKSKGLQEFGSYPTNMDSLVDRQYIPCESVPTICSSDSQSVYLDGENNSIDQQEVLSTTTPFSSIQQSERKSKFSSMDVVKIPVDISFVAGIFVLKLYRLVRNKEGNLLVNIESPDDYIFSTEKLVPLISCTINQPSILISQKVYEYSMQISLFNLLMNLHESDLDKKDFSVVLFDTKRGDLNFAGIAPSLISIRVKKTRSSKCEIDCNIAKPSTFHLSHKNIEKLANIWVYLNEAITMSTCGSPRPVIRGTQIQKIRNLIFDADRFHTKIESVKLVIYRPKVYEIKMVFIDVRCCLNFLHRPEKLNFIAAVGAFYVQTQSKICLHPIRIKLKLDFRQEIWYSSPIIYANINVNMIQFDIGVKNIRQFLSAAHHFEDTLKVTADVLEQMNQNRLGKLNIIESNLSVASLKTHELPEPIKKKHNKNRIEFYQDDLRAGAFQFVEMKKEYGLPMPYQIQIITQNNGIICWRYPQPREIRKLYIYPVPMTSVNPVEIKCKLEHYSEVHQNFLPYCEFSLSETESNDINIPKRIVTSTIWRVVIMRSLIKINEDCFKSELTDEDVSQIAQIKLDDFLDMSRNKNEQLDPKHLVGCMRIDTAFNAVNVPKIEMLFHLASMEINLQTQESELVQMPRMLKKLKIANQFSPNETFLSWIITNTKIYANFMSQNNYRIQMDTGMHLNCLDYSYLNVQNLIEEINFQTYTEVNKLNINTNIIADVIKINFGPSIMHTLIVSKRHWDEELINNQIYRILTPFTIVNRIYTDFKFGQAGTSERMFVGRRECTMYTFRSDQHAQKLVFYIVEHESEPVLIQIQNSIQFIKCGNTMLTVRTQKISETQVIVFVKAEIELLSMASETFKLQFRNVMEDGTHTEQSPEYQIDSKGRDSYCAKIFNTTQITCRLKFSGTKSKGWTGDIPLRSNKNLPWLVKVPIHDSTEFISYWIRIIRENINHSDKNQMTRQRVLITIWPVFLIRSMYTHPIKIVESSSGENIVLEGKGQTYQLSVPATHQTNHEISFLDVNFGDDKQKVDLSLKSIDWHKFFWYDDKIWTIDYALQELTKTTRVKWPCTTEDETLIKCKTHYQNCAMPIFKFFANRDFSCSLVLEISPWCIFTNLLSDKIRIRNCATNDCLVIDSNHISTVFAIEESFQIEIQCGNNSVWARSLPIYLEKNKAAANSSEYKKFVIINNNDRVELNFEETRNVILKVLLFSVFENDRIMLIMKSKYVFINNTNSLLQIIPFCCEQRDMITRSDIINKANEVAVNLPENCKAINCQGTPIGDFHDLNAMHTRQSITNFLLFVCLKKVRGAEITIPIQLNDTFNRKCFSLQNGSASIPLCASMLENNGQLFFSIFVDGSPAILVDNQTSLNFHLAQANITHTTGTNADATVVITPECDQTNFEWYQILRENSTLYYTPPEMFLNFPDIEPFTCSISLAIFNSDMPKVSKIRWSKPIETNLSCEKFFHVPMHGDVKVIVCDKHKCINISIFYVTHQKEFSAKDIRLRLSAPTINEETTTGEDDAPDNSKPCKENYSEKLDTIYKRHVECQHEHDDSTNSRKLVKMNMFIKEISFNPFIVSKENHSLKTEICSIYLEHFQLSIDEQTRDAELIISNLQIDNQLFSNGSYDFPVVLCSEKIFTHCSRIPNVYEITTELAKFQENALIKVVMKLYENNFELRSINLKLNPLRAYLEDTYLNDLFDYCLELDSNNVVAQSSSYANNAELESSVSFIPKDIEIQAQYLSEPLKLQSFRVETIHVMLSVHTCVRLYIALDHSPLEFSTYERQNILTLPIRFGHTLGMHYLSGALFGAGWVVGSLEILGSPSGLARSFSLGLRDFVSMPAQGLLRGPWGFIVGVTQGSASLLRNITAGTVNSVTKLAASVARNIDRFTLDDEHFQRTEALRRLRPQGFTEGFSQGITGLGISILGAVGGIARHTLEAKSPVEVMTGVGRGIVGAFTKPISGAAELLALTGQGVLHTVGFNAMPMQRKITGNRNISLYTADGKFWKLLPKILFTDQILFYNTATLVKGDLLKKVCICLTSSVLAVMEPDRDELRYILPVDKIQATNDPNDRTLILIRLQPNSSGYVEDENKDFTTKRIMNFLISSEQSKSQISWDSLEDILTDEKTTKNLDFSFHISENMGAHLLNYLKILKSINN